MQQGVTEETTAESTVNCQETAQAVTSNVITIDMSSATPVAASPEGDGTSLVTEPDSISAGTQVCHLVQEVHRCVRMNSRYAHNVVGAVYIICVSV